MEAIPLSRRLACIIYHSPTAQEAWYNFTYTAANLHDYLPADLRHCLQPGVACGQSYWHSKSFRHLRENSMFKMLAREPACALGISPKSLLSKESAVVSCRVFVMSEGPHHRQVQHSRCHRSTASGAGQPDSAPVVHHLEHRSTRPFHRMRQILAFCSTQSVLGVGILILFLQSPAWDAGFFCRDAVQL